jgi:hypothetical protein
MLVMLLPSFGSGSWSDCCGDRGGVLSGDINAYKTNDKKYTEQNCVFTVFEN